MGGKIEEEEEIEGETAAGEIEEEGEEAEVHPEEHQRFLCSLIGFQEYLLLEGLKMH